MGLGKPIEGNFDGGQISSDGGLLLLRMADQRLDLSESVKFCFPENRRPDRIKHTLESLLRQRIYAIAPATRIAMMQPCSGSTRCTGWP
ncbi:MAG: transposase [Candidatus Melainabacteria bacterium]|nr:transposase [Candidatus Melainabacteria bacterium]